MRLRCNYFISIDCVNYGCVFFKLKRVCNCAFANKNKFVQPL